MYLMMEVYQKNGEDDKFIKRLMKMISVLIFYL